MNIQAKISNQTFWNVSFVLIGWTLFALFFASQSYLRRVYFGNDADFRHHLAVWLVCGYSWAMVTPVILFLARRFPFSRQTWHLSLLTHIPASVIFSLAALGIFSAFQFFSGRSQDGFMTGYLALVVAEIHASVLVYFGMIGVVFLWNYLKPVNQHPVAVIDVPIESNAPELQNGSDNSTDPLNEDTVITESQRPVFPKRFSIKQNGRILFVNVEELDRVTSEGNYIKLHANGKAYLLRETMKAMEQKLDPKVFVRIRRSAIIRIDQIKELHPLFNGEFEIVLKGDTKITSSRRYRKNLDEILTT